MDEFFDMDDARDTRYEPARSERFQNDNTRNEPARSGRFQNNNTRNAPTGSATINVDYNYFRKLEDLHEKIISGNIYVVITDIYSNDKYISFHTENEAIKKASEVNESLMSGISNLEYVCGNYKLTEERLSRRVNVLEAELDAMKEELKVSRDAERRLMVMNVWDFIKWRKSSKAKFREIDGR
jgi:hypothetical protein